MSQKVQLEFSIEGLHCGGCVGRAEAALHAVQGVASAEVNLATGRAQVSGDGTLSSSMLVEALDQAGYPARIEEVEFELDNLSCAGCVGRAERALSAVSGTIAAHVNLATSKAHVSWLGPRDQLSLYRDAVSAAGYPARRAAPLRLSSEPDQDDTETHELAQQLGWAALLALPVMLLSMGVHMVPALARLVDGTVGTRGNWFLQFILTTAILAGPGALFLRRGLPALWRRAPDMNSLVALGTLAAWGYSSVALFFPALLPSDARTVYFEAAAVITLLILLGRWLEARAKRRTGAAIRALVALRPDTADVLRHEDFVEIPVDEIVTGDILRARPGTRIAVDGIITQGIGTVDEAMMTGEPLPVSKSEGDPVTGGTVNGAAVLHYRATRVGADTALAGIIRMVEQAQGAKLPIQAVVDRITYWFVPAVLGIAVLTVLVWLLLGPTIAHALVAGVSVLIIACPCAMGLATPVSIMVGTGRAAERGVLFRGGAALQALGDVRLVAFDKTGTLTTGAPELVGIHMAKGDDQAAALRLAAACEEGSEHPLALAIRDAAEGSLPVITDQQIIPGQGITARFDDHDVALGSRRFMLERGIEAPASHRPEATPVYLALGGRLLARFDIADTLKADSAETIAALGQRDIRTALITGDVAPSAQALARQLGLTQVTAEVLPAEKVAALTSLGAGPRAFVGDGINDAPVLAAAEVGIAIGTGTDIAIEAADVVLMSGDPRGVVTAIDLSRKTMANIRQNLFWAFGYNALLIPVAAGALYPLFGVMLSPMLAAGAMGLSSVFVLSNALRLKRA